MAIVKKYSARVLDMVNQIPGVYTVFLESLDKPFKYDPGQFLHLALDEYDPAGQWPESRCFSIQSPPGEECIKITFAVKGQFTSQMQHELKPGKIVSLKLPYGDLFSQPHNKINTVFIAGGTGITPFLSLFNHKSFEEYINPHIYLGFRSISYNIYKKELNFVKLRQSFAEVCDLKIYYEDLDGVIDINKIFNANGIRCDYFISGPPLMIRSFKKHLTDNNVLEKQVKTDDWY
jgi:ferredoxin-NADP reductase